MNRRGKLLTLSTAVVGVAVLVAAGLAGMEWIREEWYLRKLETGNTDEQVVAAERLGELRSVRAVPVLVTKLIGELATSRNIDKGELLESYIGPREGLLGERGVGFQKALVKIGKPATLVLLKARRKHSDLAAIFLTSTFLEIYPCQETPQLSGNRRDSCDELVLQQLRDDPAQALEVRNAAAEVREALYPHER